jgi:ubiquitin-conjugating enzyme (huntingtin interacting protein 2)
MLMNYPEQFDRVAREWAVKYAGAPKQHLNATSPVYQQKAPKVVKSREQEQRELMAK